MFCHFPEILAPVGGREQLEAAVKAGANAVYLAGTAFGARSSAANFDREQLAEAIRYAHLHDVSVYITVNTLILDSEFDAAMDFVDFLYRNDADALIVQDVGLMSAIMSRYPDFDLHASTQMTFHNLAGVMYAKSLGFSRVVLPREMSLTVIKEISEQSDMELEVFIHGALCVSYSGMCLMSSYIGGRSGNRGSCAQPCRKRYALYSLDEERRYHVEDAGVLSPKDLSAVPAMDALVNIPKISLKIEGRLKDKYYVYNVVSAYRKLVDGHITPEQASMMLEKSYHRGYTKGFLLGESIVDFNAGMHTGNRGVRLGTVLDFRKGIVRIKLEEPLHRGDEIQCRREDGGSVGGRAERIAADAERIVKDSKRIDRGSKRIVKDVERIAECGADIVSAPAGAVVSVPFKHQLFPGETLYKTFSVEQNAWIDRELNRDVKIWKIRIKAYFKVGEPSRLTAYIKRLRNSAASDISSISAEVFGEIVEPATGRGTEKNRIAEQLCKTGGTPFHVAKDESEFDIGEGVFVPISAVNALRRDMFEQLAAQLERRYPDRNQEDGRVGRHSDVKSRCTEGFEKSEDFLSAMSSCTPDEERAEIISANTTTPEISRKVFSPSAVFSGASALSSGDMKYFVLPPVISTADWERYQRQVDSADIVEIGHISHLAFRGLEKKRLIGSYNLNILNSHALEFYLGRGLTRTEISSEIRRDDIRQVSNKKPNHQQMSIQQVSIQPANHEQPNHERANDLKDSISFSAGEIVNLNRERITLMRMAYCPVGAYFGGGQKCGLCKKYDFALRDEKGVEFPLHLDERTCMAEVLSPGAKRRGKKITDVI